MKHYSEDRFVSRSDQPKKKSIADFHEKVSIQDDSSPAPPILAQTSSGDVPISPVSSEKDPFRMEIEALGWRISLG
jgi:hypothetical protein